MKLSPDQQSAIDAFYAWYCDLRKPIFALGGFAGTGKSTCLSYLAAAFAGLNGGGVGISPSPLVAYIAYTGRAASLLSNKFRTLGVTSTNKTQLPSGVKLSAKASNVCYTPGSRESRLPFVGTIHRLLYRPVIDAETEELKGWAKRDKLDRDYDLIICDEASMIGDDILNDIRPFNVPIFAVGDHAQLPPVMASGALMREPDVRLETIHRQAADNPIIQLAAHLRQGGLLREFPKKLLGGKIVFAGKNEVARVLEETLPGAGLEAAVICWTNRMRIRLNGMARAALGIKGPPRKNDLIVALKNYPPIYNGMRGRLLSDATPGHRPWWLNLDVEFPEDAIQQTGVLANAAQFNRERPFASVEELQARGIDVQTISGAGQMFDFGYAMTCHKMQGSQAQHVIVYIDRPEDPENEDYRRWIYTAVTRSSDRLTVLK